GKSKKLKPYLQIGGFFRVGTTAFKSMALFITEPGVTRYPKTVKNISIENQIAKYNSGFVIGAGIRYQIRDIHLALEVNYKHAFNNIVNEAGRWGNSELLYHYYDVFDDMKVKSLDVSFKVLFPISFKAFGR
ncbi:MAG: hypothetical protein GY950_01320, partial [bacterium]|nr:hypothetical protein [bacterium]